MIFSKKIIILLLLILIILIIAIIRISIININYEKFGIDDYLISPQNKLLNTINVETQNKAECKMNINSIRCYKLKLQYLKDDLITKIENKINLNNFFDASVNVKDSKPITGIIKIVKDLDKLYQSDKLAKKSKINYIDYIAKIKTIIDDFDDNNFRFIFQLSKNINEAKFQDDFDNFSYVYKEIAKKINTNKKIIKNIKNINGLESTILFSENSTTTSNSNSNSISPTKLNTKRQVYKYKSQEASEIINPNDEEYLDSIKQTYKNYVFEDFKKLLNVIGKEENNKVVLINSEELDNILKSDNFSNNPKMNNKLVNNLQNKISNFTNNIKKYYEINKNIKINK
jgi:hypothetical protein